MAYLAEPEKEYFKGIDFTQYGINEDCPNCPKPKEYSELRKNWNFVADNIISKPIEGLEFFGYFFYGLGQVPGEMYKQDRMEKSIRAKIN